MTSKLMLLLFVLCALAACGPGSAVANSPQPAPTPSNAISTPATLPATPTPVPPTATVVIQPTPVAISANRVDVKVVEPSFKPPQAWTFDPITITLKVNTKIHWTNTGAILHTITADDKQTFNSGDLQPQAEFDFTPTRAGTIAYHCNYHPWMTGTIIVQP